MLIAFLSSIIVIPLMMMQYKPYETIDIWDP